MNFKPGKFKIPLLPLADGYLVWKCYANAVASALTGRATPQVPGNSALVRYRLQSEAAGMSCSRYNNLGDDDHPLTAKSTQKKGYWETHNLYLSFSGIGCLLHPNE